MDALSLTIRLSLLFPFVINAYFNNIYNNQTVCPYVDYSNLASVSITENWGMDPAYIPINVCFAARQLWTDIKYFNSETNVIDFNEKYIKFICTGSNATTDGKVEIYPSTDTNCSGTPENIVLFDETELSGDNNDYFMVCDSILNASDCGWGKKTMYQKSDTATADSNCSWFYEPNGIDTNDPPSEWVYLLNVCWYKSIYNYQGSRLPVCNDKNQFNYLKFSSSEYGDICSLSSDYSDQISGYSYYSTFDAITYIGDNDGLCTDSNTDLNGGSYLSVSYDRFVQTECYNSPYLGTDLIPDFIPKEIQKPDMVTINDCQVAYKSPEPDVDDPKYYPVNTCLPTIQYYGSTYGGFGAYQMFKCPLDGTQPMMEVYSDSDCTQRTFSMPFEDSYEHTYDKIDINCNGTASITDDECPFLFYDVYDQSGSCGCVCGDLTPDTSWTRKTIFMEAIGECANYTDGDNINTKMLVCGDEPYEVIFRRWYDGTSDCVSGGYAETVIVDARSYGNNSCVNPITSSRVYGNVTVSNDLCGPIPTTTDPTSDPTLDPTFDPTDDPTTGDPTNDPTSDPTDDPTNDPTFDPTSDPTERTDGPTSMPTGVPTNEPTTNEPTTSQPTDDMSVIVDETIGILSSTTELNEAGTGGSQQLVYFGVLVMNLFVFMFCL